MVSRIRSSPRTRLIAPALFLAFCALALTTQILTFRLSIWPDEFETMIASKMMGSGARLYRDVFDQHGPLVFAFGLIVEKLTRGSFTAYRGFVLLAQWALIGTMLICGWRMKRRHAPLAAAVVLMMMTVYLPRVAGHMFMYQAFAGLFVAIALEVLVLPTIAGRPVTRGATIFGAVLIGSLPFLAFTYGPATLGLLLCALRKETLRDMAIGLGIAILVNLLFLIGWGSIAGFIADHLYLNLVIYPKYGENNAHQMFSWQTRSWYYRVTIPCLLMMIAGAFALIRRERGPIWRVGLLVLAVLSLLARGPDFQGIPFYYAILPFIGLALQLLPEDRWYGRGIGCLIAAFSAYKLIGLLLATQAPGAGWQRMPISSPFSRLVRKYSAPSDRILVYSFMNNVEYLLADRLPASPDFYLLPQQTDYDRRPILGITYDPCRDIRVNQPKFVLLDRWNAWQRIPWSQYQGCVEAALQPGYHVLPDGMTYVRNDLWPTVRQDQDATQPHH